MRKIIPILLIGLLAAIFFWQFIVRGLLPIPSDTIIGLYHPFRDLYAKDYPRGIPFKNFLITDPVRQQYPWKELAISLEKKFQLPLWNPYNFSGTPLLANFQSASFYPLNILFFIMPFVAAWSFIIFLGPLLGGIFLFLYLDNLKLGKLASVLGAVTFSFSGFFIAWMEWGTITHTALWLPLILLSIDKIFFNFQGNSKLKVKNSKLWYFIFIFSLISSFFAGHLQIFFYLFVFSWIYFLARWLQYGRKINILVLYLILNTLYLILTVIQWAPTLQLILLSARDIDQIRWGEGGWFIPFQHLIQFVAPDFFGNPTTLNYWGVWNYGEFVGYVGIITLILALLAMFFRKDKKTLFFGTMLFLSLIFSLPTFFAKIPYYLNIPLISTSQPTRLLFVIDFCLAVLTALGFDYILKVKKKNTILYPLIFISIVFAGLWIFISKEHLMVAKNNLILPTLLLISSWVLFIVWLLIRDKKRPVLIICVLVLGIAVFDLLRFGWKFTPFTQKSYVFPETKAIAFLQKNLEEFRIMTEDSRILPSNFSTIYRIQSVDGYDPLYLRRYAELIAASERGKPDISTPLGFNRIITPNIYASKIIDLLGVKYVLSLSELNSFKLKKVFQEGETRIFENKNVLPRVFFVPKITYAKDNKEAISLMFDDSFIPNDTAIVELTQGGVSVPPLRWKIGEAEIAQYSENKIVINTKNIGNGFLVLTDSYYPTWHATVDGDETKIYRTDYNFRGIIVPAGKHTIEFHNSLF